MKRKMKEYDQLKSEIPIMNKKILIKLFEQVFRTRSVEEEIAKRYKFGKMRCPTHLSIGQESVPAALSLIMRKKILPLVHIEHMHIF